jgi:serine/threonine-protein kinase
MTQSGILVGTPFYMSPEQAEGAHDIDAGTDVWAMGVTLYRCFTGTLPFFTTSPSALLLAIARGEHVPVGERAPSLPKPIAAWVEGALVNDRARRYRDMSEMLAALDRALAGEIVETAPPASAPEATGQALPSQPSLEAVAPPRRVPIAAWGAAAVALVLLALLGVRAFFSSGDAPPRAPVIAVSPPPTVAPAVSPPTTPPATTTEPSHDAAATATPTEAPSTAPATATTSDPARTRVRRPRPPRGETGPAETTPSEGRSHSGLASEW